MWWNFFVGFVKISFITLADYFGHIEETSINPSKSQSSLLNHFFDDSIQKSSRIYVPSSPSVPLQDRYWCKSLWKTESITNGTCLTALVELLFQCHSNCIVQTVEGKALGTWNNSGELCRINSVKCRLDDMCAWECLVGRLEELVHYTCYARMN